MKSVDKGIALLDERLPGWRTQIDPEQLDLQFCSTCILGQLFGNYDKGIEVLAVDGKAYGFHRRRRNIPWWRLTEAWRKAVRA